MLALLGWGRVGEVACLAVTTEHELIQGMSPPHPTLLIYLGTQGSLMLP